MVNKDYRKVYGFCLGCEKYVPRDDMISTTLTVFGEGIDEKQERVRFRLCPECHKNQMKRWKTSWNNNSIVWRNDIKSACEIMTNEKLASRCDDIEFDDQDQNAILEVLSLRDRRK